MVAWETGHPADAVREAQVALKLDPDNANTMAEAGYVLASAGDTGRAKELLAKLRSLAHDGSAFATAPAMIEMGLGQPDQAVETLKDQLVTFAKMRVGLSSLTQWHAFDALASNAHYQTLLAQNSPAPTAEAAKSQ